MIIHTSAFIGVRNYEFGLEYGEIWVKIREKQIKRVVDAKF